MKRILVTLVLLLAWSAAGAATPASCGVATAHPLATAAAREILDNGGNAFDAAVAAASTLAVVEPFGSGLGGGGFFLLHRAFDAYDVLIDGREMAPLAAAPDMYLDAGGEPVPRASLDGARAAAIPGLPAAIVHVATRYGRLPLAASLAPAIRAARDGFAVSAHYVRWAEGRAEALRASPAAATVLLDDHFVPDPGFVLRQPALAATLARLAEHGHDGFYRGELAARLVAGVRAAGGIWSEEDLALYRVVERAPVPVSYRGLRLTSAPLPSSGGLLLAQMLGVLEGFELERMPPAERTRVIVEAMRHAYRRRVELGDADFVSVDSARLLDSAMIERIRQDIRAGWRRMSPGRERRESGANTTHFSILDREGNRVAATLSLNLAFGSGFMPPGTGVLLNNQMDDFALKPGLANVYGLPGGVANAIAPGKRPLSNMTPTFVETDRHVLLVGTPGGGRIISMVLLAVLEFARGEHEPGVLVAGGRFHHQDMPDRLEYEPAALDAAARQYLQAAGYPLHPVEGGYGNMQALMWDKETGRVAAAADPRGEGSALGH